SSVFLQYRKVVPVQVVVPWVDAGAFHDLQAAALGKHGERLGNDGIVALDCVVILLREVLPATRSLEVRRVDEGVAARLEHALEVAEVLPHRVHVEMDEDVEGIDEVERLRRGVQLGSVKKHEGDVWPTGEVDLRTFKHVRGDVVALKALAFGGHLRRDATAADADLREDAVRVDVRVDVLLYDFD